MNSSGNYSVVATNSIGCSAISPISTVATLALPNATINSINPTTFCLGGGTNLSAPINSGYQYQWFKNNTLIVGATSSLYLATTTGSYKVFITNSSGCSNFSNNTINVNALPLPSLDIFGDSVICLGEMTTITVDSDGSVTLNGIPNLNILQVSPSNTTEYNVVSQGTNGCTSSATLTIEVHYAEDTSIFMSSYGPLVMAGQTFTQSGVYTLDLNSVYGCDSTVTLNLNVLFNDIETIETSDLTIINPVKNGLIHIRSEDIEVIEFNGIYDILGREISYESIVANTGGITIQISVPIGAYNIHFEQDGKFIQKKFIVID